MKIPNWNWNCRRLNEDLTPIPPDCKARLKPGEFRIASLKPETDGHPECVQLALDDLIGTLRRFSAGQGGELPLKIRIRKNNGRSREFQAEVTRSGISIAAETALGATRAL